MTATHTLLIVIPLAVADAASAPGLEAERPEGLGGVRVRVQAWARALAALAPREDVSLAGEPGAVVVTGDVTRAVRALETA